MPCNITSETHWRRNKSHWSRQLLQKFGLNPLWSLIAEKVFLKEENKFGVWEDCCVTPMHVLAKDKCLMQLRIQAWKSQDFNVVWTRDLAIPVRRSHQLSYQATDVGRWSFMSSNEPVKNGCEVIYEMFHILNCGFEIK